MSRGRWLTPDSLGDLESVCVYVPGGQESKSALLGALVLLTKVWNWEEYGSKTPEETAAAWLDALFEYKGELCMPVGSIVAFGATVPPSGWLLCDGGEYNREDWPALFDVIQTTWGSSGSTKFNVPDLRGRAPIGTGSAPGLTTRTIASAGGEEKHTLTEAEMPEHSHTISNVTAAITQDGAGLMRLAYPLPGGSLTTSTAGGDGSHENMPPFAAVTYIIKAR